MSDKKSILQMAHGAIEERVDLEMSKIMDNILDPNTKATEKRKLTITIEFMPDENRQIVGVKTIAKTSLAATTAITTSLFVSGESGSNNIEAVEIGTNVPGQQNMFGEQTEVPPVLKLIRCS